MLKKHKSVVKIETTSETASFIQKSTLPRQSKEALNA